MVRERPAAHIMMGYFYAESLLLAETGSTTGAIQIAGTDALLSFPSLLLPVITRLWVRNSMRQVLIYRVNLSYCG